ncbi:hypothetical protein P4O66_010327 [Electrophorus voltai]|uniref:Uncharacterized protein n=1 Tax=Electrophorus voltai TaxID=2609070 RepID=A0AAD8Z955_9TELE|nr:hypothetical protein P4O66_010327 [Electrophorus voltai]
MVSLQSTSIKSLEADNNLMVPQEYSDLAQKKDRGLRPCVDYRGLNSLLVQYPYPLPLVPAVLEQGEPGYS